MLQFDWTITLGNLISTVAMLMAFVGGAYRLVNNHFAHFGVQVTRLETALQQHVDLCNTQFASLDKDIRELRDWTIVMRGRRPK